MTKRLLGVLAAVALLTAPARPAHAQFGDPLGGIEPFGNDGRSSLVSAEVVPSHTVLAPGQTFHLAMRLRIEDDWALYSPAPGVNFDAKGERVEVGPASLEVTAKEWPLGDIRWPMHHRYVSGEFVNWVYKGSAVVYVPVTVPTTATAGHVTVKLTLHGQVCSPDSCVNVDVPASASLRVGTEPQPNPDWSDTLAAGLDDTYTADQLAAELPQKGTATAPPGVSADAPAYGIVAGLGLALLAGLALNIMPCVLPVIPLRILSLVQMAGESRRRFVTLGLAFAAGIVAVFAVFAAISAVASEALNLSAHFQLDVVRLVMALIVVAIAANMFGVFNVVVPTKVASMEAAGPRGWAHTNSFFMGLMMAVLSTPCSFGILAAVMLWAQTQPTALGALAVLMVGVGMAAPHVLLAGMPSLVKKLPRPGKWMEHFKHATGFILLLVAVWLFSTFATDVYPFWLIAFAVVLTMGLWIWANWVRYDAPLRRKLLVRGLAVVLVVAAGWGMLPRPEPAAVRFENFSRSRLARSIGGDQPVVVKFTASWCIKCIQLEQTVYDDPDLESRLDELGVVRIKADVTHGDSSAATYLKREVGGAPPLTLVFPPGRDRPIRLVGTYTTDDLLEAIRSGPRNEQES
ncbi:MAG: cytochrome c biogenesis protein CcdA [Phycisphaerae bacterium]